MNDKGLIVGSGVHVGKRIFIPVAEIAKTMNKHGAWIQVVPIAVVVVDEKEEYVLSMTEDTKLEELETRVPALSAEIQRLESSDRSIDRAF